MSKCPVGFRLFKSLRKEALFFDDNLAARWFIHAGGLSTDVSVNSIFQRDDFTMDRSVKSQVRALFRRPGNSNLEMGFAALRNLNLYREIFSSLQLKPREIEKFPGLKIHEHTNVAPGNLLIASPVVDSLAQNSAVYLVTDVTDEAVWMVNIAEGARLVSRPLKHRGKVLLHEQVTAAAMVVGGVAVGTSDGVEPTGRMKLTKAAVSIDRSSLDHLITVSVESSDVLKDIVFSNPRTIQVWKRIMCSVSDEFAEIMRLPDEAHSALLRAVSAASLHEIDEWVLDDLDEELRE